jgi:hypothetical protein
MTTKCARCDDTLWVCEAHNDLPWDRASPHACQCGACRAQTAIQAPASRAIDLIDSAESGGILGQRGSWPHQADYLWRGLVTPVSLDAAAP